MNDCDNLYREDYYFLNLPYHLSQANMADDLRAILMEFEFLQYKSKCKGVRPLVEDYEYEPDDKELKLIQRALEISADVIQKDKTQLAGQLLGRLLRFDKLANIKSLLNQTKKYKDAPWLRPLISNLRSARDALLYQLVGHSSFVTGIAITPDSQKAVSTSQDKTLKVWDLTTGQELFTLKGHAKSVEGVVITSNGKKAVSVSRDKIFKVWDLTTGRELLTFGNAKVSKIKNLLKITPANEFNKSRFNLIDLIIDLLEFIIVMTFRDIRNSTKENYHIIHVIPNSKILVSALESNTPIIWDLETGSQIVSLAGHRSVITAIALTNNGKRAVSASKDKTLKIWDLETGKDLLTFTKHQAAVTTVATAPNNSKLVMSGSEDGILKVWNLDTGEELFSIPGHDKSVKTVCVSPNQKAVSLAVSDEKMKVWDLTTGKEVFTLTGHTDWVTAFTMTSDGRFAVSGSLQGTLKVWNLNTGNEVFNFTKDLPSMALVKVLTITPDNKRVIAASSQANTNVLRVWDLATDTEAQTLSSTLAVVNKAWVWHPNNLLNAIAITPDGTRVISDLFDKNLKVWDLDTGDEILTLTGHADWVNAVAITPDGKQAVSASRDRTLKVWDLDTGDEILTLTGHADWVNAVAITPDGKQAVSASRDRTLKVWDLDTSHEILTLAGHYSSVNAVAITPNAQQVISASGGKVFSQDNSLKIWDLATGKEIKTLTGSAASVTTLAITPDGRQIVSGSGDSTLKVWDLTTGEEVRTLTGHSSIVTAIAFNPDGQRIASVSFDKSIKIWNLASANNVFKLEQQHQTIVTAVAISLDGKRAVSSSLDGTLKVWNLATGKRLSVFSYPCFVFAVAIAPNSKQAFASVSTCGELKAFDLTTDREILVSIPKNIIGVTAIAITPDGHQLLCGLKHMLRASLKVVDLTIAQEIFTLQGHRDWIHSIAVTPDGKRAVSASRDRTLKVWNLTTGEEVYTLTGHRDWVSAAAITPDGCSVVSASKDKTLKVWDLTTYEEVLTFLGHTHAVTGVAITPNGKWVASVSGDHTLKVWDIVNGKELMTFSAEGSFSCCDISPDGNTIVAGELSGKLHFLCLEGLDQF